MDHLKWVFIILTIFFSACEPATEDNTSENQHKPYVPKGDRSDLVYNPIRSDGTIDSSYLPIIAFDATEFDYGEILEGDIIEHDFEFKNVGTAPLLIAEAKSSCGCTVPEWSKEPVAPGTAGTIKVKFDSKGRAGAQNKEVTIFANTIPSKSVLRIKGTVAKN